MNIAIVIQRYGSEVLGGAEQLCRLVAERLAARHQIDVLTTCARDYITWANAYPEGTDRVRGVTVRRFPVTRTRDIDTFNQMSDRLFGHRASRADELEWLKHQGPWSPALVEYLRRHHQQYDVVVFFTYLYATTVLGMEVCPGKSLVVPTAHDEPAIHLGLFTDVFSKAAGLLYLTESERRFVARTFPQRPLLEEVVGVGIDLPLQQAYPRMPQEPEDHEPRALGGARATRALAEDEAGLSTSPEEPLRLPHIASRGAVFRRRHRLHGPFALYGGRIDPGKGCEELLHYFNAFVAAGGDATLALMGAKLMPLPEDDPSVRFAGLLSDTERAEALEAADVVICPSPYESLSLLALEALSVGTPVLVNARSEVLVEHCVRSNAGLWYADRDEFVACLRLLMQDGTLRSELGRNGRAYVDAHYRWPVVLEKWERAFASVRQAR